jgi:hypothetical protein
MERQRLVEHEAAKKLEATQECSRLVMKLRWLGMEEEAKRLQAMVRGSVLAGPFSTD